MTSYIVLFLDYLSDISPYNKRSILENLEIEVVNSLEYGEQDSSEYSRIPLQGYSSLATELRRSFGQNSASALAGLIAAGPENVALSRFSGISREALYAVYDYPEYFLSRVPQWGTDPHNWLLVKSHLGAFEIQSQISEKFPCLVIENGPVECASTGSPDVNLSNVEDILQSTGLYQVWNSSHQGPVGKVCVLDTGVNTKLQASHNIRHGSVDGLNSTDADGHGSAVVELIHALSPQSEIESIKVLESYTGGQIWNLIAGLTQLHARRNIIVNMSLSVSLSWMANLGMQAVAFRETISNILSSMASQNNFTICAAGNDSTGSIRWPAASPNALAVGSHTKSYNLSSFSNYCKNASNFVLAPGGDLNIEDSRVSGFGSYGLGLTREIYGTSFSAAIVSAITSTLSSYDWFSRMQSQSRISLFRNQCRTNRDGYSIVNIPDIGAVWPI